MHLLPDETRQLARLLRVLMYGEYIAQDCASQQAKMRQSCAPRTAKFLRAQARQERFHHGVFKSALLWINHRELKTSIPSQPLDHLHQKVLSAIDEDRYSESVLGLQLVLEGMGEAVLARIDSGMNDRKIGLNKVRRIILHQEQAHHSFGIREYEKSASTDNISLSKQNTVAQEYLDLSWQTFCELDPVFETFGEDKADYQADVVNCLPDNLRPTA